MSNSSPVSGFFSFGQDGLQCGQVQESINLNWHLGASVTLRTFNVWRFSTPTCVADDSSSSFRRFSLNSFLLCRFKSRLFSFLSFLFLFLSSFSCCFFSFLSRLCFSSSSVSTFFFLFPLLFFLLCLRLELLLSRLLTRSLLKISSSRSIWSSSKSSGSCWLWCWIILFSFWQESESPCRHLCFSCLIRRRFLLSRLLSRLEDMPRPDRVLVFSSSCRSVRFGSRFFWSLVEMLFRVLSMSEAASIARTKLLPVLKVVKGSSASIETLLKNKKMFLIMQKYSINLRIRKTFNWEGVF